MASSVITRYLKCYLLSRWMKSAQSDIANFHNPNQYEHLPTLSSLLEHRRIYSSRPNKAHTNSTFALPLSNSSREQAMYKLLTVTRRHYCPRHHPTIVSLSCPTYDVVFSGQTRLNSFTGAVRERRVLQCINDLSCVHKSSSVSSLRRSQAIHVTVMQRRWTASNGLA